MTEKKQFMPFVLDDIFDIFSSNSGIDKNKLKIGEGNIPYITRTDKNNGIDTFVCEQNSNKYKKDGGNVITIGLDTQTIFYQRYDFYTGQNIQILSNPNLTFESALYIIPLLKLVLEKFSWGSNGATLTRLKRSKIMLPANNENKPDFNFMSNHIKEALFKEIDNLKKYCNSRLKNIEYKSIDSLKTKKWRHFLLSDICLIESGMDIYDLERIDGNIPYITSTSINNGIKYFVNNINKTKSPGSISVNRNGSVGFAFYHKYDALYSNDCRKLTVKKCNNEYVSLFITNQIMQQKEKYGYGYKMGTARLQKQNILLPVDGLNEPDYEYMEQYIKNIMFEQYSRYLQFLED